MTPLPDPSGFLPDPLTDILRSGARRLIEQAVEAELAVLLAAHADDKTEDGRSRVVRHGYLPEREVMSGIGPVPVNVPRVRDWAAGVEKVRFASSILPPYLRKAKSVEELLPWLYLKGISSGDFQEALAALLGPNAAGLSSTTISRLPVAHPPHSRRCFFCFHSASSAGGSMRTASPWTGINTLILEDISSCRRSQLPMPTLAAG